MANGHVVRRVGARVWGEWVLGRMAICMIRDRTREGGRRGRSRNANRGWRSALLEWISRSARRRAACHTAQRPARLGYIWRAFVHRDPKNATAPHHLVSAKFIISMSDDDSPLPRQRKRYCNSAGPTGRLRCGRRRAHWEQRRTPSFQRSDGQRCWQRILHQSPVQAANEQ